MPSLLLRTVLVVIGFLSAVGAQGFVNYESGQVNPIRLSADGTRLFVCNTPDNRLSVFSTANPNQPVLLAEIPVGLEPVSVAPRTADEVWVANLLSDSISIVSLSAGRVVATLRAKDEPSDIVFAGTKAFVSIAASDRVLVFDVNTRLQLASVNVFGKDPRAMATNPAGTKVYALVQRSGNKSTILERNNAPPQPAPTNPALPAAPDEGMIVLAGDPQWPTITWTLPDNDIAEIDVTTHAVSRYFNGVGTTNFSMVVHPLSGSIYVTNTEARNLVRFEPTLRGHAIDSRVTRVTTTAVPQITVHDLNPGVNYTLFPNNAAKAIALAEPAGVALHAASDELFVAAFGTDRIGVLQAATGAILARIDLTPTGNTLNKRGPRGLALNAGTGRLYVLNRLSQTLSTVDTSGRVVIGEMPLASFEPTPSFVRDGRKFLYDAKLSGNGTMSCASCHVDGDMDGLAWDLGNPAGSLEAPPTQPFPFSIALTSFHPMKGPMTTQTLRGMAGSGALHWRGDRPTFLHFNPAFSSLMGGTELGTADMATYSQFAMSIGLMPNPNQPFNRSYLTTPNGANQQQGATSFAATIATLPIIGAVSCNTCHALPTGSNQMVVAGQLLQEPQQMKVPHLRNLYRKAGFDGRTGQQKSGFGYTHDGASTTLTEFLAIAQFNTWPTNIKDDIVQFLLGADTGTAPLVGYQVTVNSSTAGSIGSDLSLMINRASAGDIELIGKGSLNGAPIGLLWASNSSQFFSDTNGQGPWSQSQMLNNAQSGALSVVLTGVAPGTGVRSGIDRDQDGIADGNEGLLVYGSATNGVGGNPVLGVNSEPRRGNSVFAFIARSAPASGTGWLVLSGAMANLNINGLILNVDVLTAPPVMLPMLGDSAGVGTLPLSIPDVPVLAGLVVFAQCFWQDSAATSGWSGTRGLAVTVQ
ncbi:MAG: hypothetical protein EXS14_09760 [Planctomycetes bacterium]|nr:hypothetical protein [Planctomycetota bacterium]